MTNKEMTNVDYHSGAIDERRLHPCGEQLHAGPRRTSFVACRASFVAGVPIHLLARSIGTRKTLWQKEFGDPNLRKLAVHAVAQHRLVTAADAPSPNAGSPRPPHTPTPNARCCQQCILLGFFPPTYCS